MSVSLQEIEEYWSLDDLQDYHEAKDYMDDFELEEELARKRADK